MYTQSISLVIEKSKQTYEKSAKKYLYSNKVI